MKKVFIITLVILSCLISNVFAEIDLSIYQKAGAMIDKYWEEDYIENIKLKLGSNVMIVNGEEKPFDNYDSNIVPTVIDGKCMIPVRTISEELDAKIEFDSEMQTVSLVLDDIDVEMKIGSNIIKVLDEEKKTSVAPIIENGRTLLPIRDIADNIGFDIEWKEKEKEIELTNNLQMKRIMVQTTKKISFDEFDVIDCIDIGDNFYIVQFDTIGKTKKAYEKLKNMETVKYVELDRIVSLESNDETYPSTSYSYTSWGGDRMKFGNYIDYLNKNNKNSEVVVAVLDTGIDLTHVVFYNRIKPGGINISYGESENLVDNNGHGTHVAGIIADLTKGTNVKILPIKIAKDTKSSYSQMNLAIDYAIKMGVDIVNLSFVHDGVSSSILDKLIDNNIVPVFAAGNDNKDMNDNKIGNEKSIEVGAIAPNDDRAHFSNYGDRLDIVAPGVDIVSAKVGGGYIAKSGTSMATPHISSAIALYRINNNKMTIQQIEKQLKATADDLGTIGKDVYFGYGVPNMYKASVLSENDVNTCELCATTIKNDWYDDGVGNHYHECQNRHKYSVGIHVDSDESLECDICKFAITTCYVCKAKLKSGWYTTDNNYEIHYKLCEAGHSSYVKKHTIMEGKCNVCGFEQKVNDENKNNEILFSDLPKEHWAYDEVKAMVEVGIVIGRDDGSIGVNDYITVEEVITLLAKLAEKKGLNKADGNAYLQNQITSWSKEGYISLMKVIGAKTGESSGELGKKEIQILLGNKDSEIIGNYKLPITREKIANFMGIFIEDGINNPNNVLKAKDWSKVNSVYRGRINELAERNIFRGAQESDGIYIKPTDNVKRVEVIALINRLYNTM